MLRKSIPQNPLKSPKRDQRATLVSEPLKRHKTVLNKAPVVVASGRVSKAGGGSFIKNESVISNSNLRSSTYNNHDSSSGSSMIYQPRRTTTGVYKNAKFEKDSGF